METLQQRAEETNQYFIELREPAQKSRMIMGEHRETQPGFSDFITYTLYVATFKFVDPIIDFNERDNERLRLVVTAFNPNDNPFWCIKLDSEKGFCIGNRSFGHLRGSTSHYSREKLEEWQKEGKEEYESGVIAIRDLYYSRKPMPKGFIGLK